MKIVILLQILFISLININFVTSCRCMRPLFQDIEKDFLKTDAIFTGYATKVVKGTGTRIYEFNVLKKWKGKSIKFGKTVDISTGTDCFGSTFNLYTQYIIWAGYSNGKLTTHLCTRNGLYMDNKVVMKELDRITRK